MREKMLSIKDDLEWEFFRAGGKGGQNQNKRDTAARVRHRPSGAVGESREERHQMQNRVIALRRLANSAKFRLWVAEQHLEIEQGLTLDQRIAKMMEPHNLKVEVRRDGEWTLEGDELRLTPSA